MRRLLAVCCALALRALPLEAQFPAELAGRVLERGGAPIENALVEIDGGGRASTDASGSGIASAVPARMRAPGTCCSSTRRMPSTGSTAITSPACST